MADSRSGINSGTEPDADTGTTPSVGHTPEGTAPEEGSGAAGNPAKPAGKSEEKGSGAEKASDAPAPAESKAIEAAEEAPGVKPGGDQEELAKPAEDPVEAPEPGDEAGEAPSVPSPDPKEATDPAPVSGDEDGKDATAPLTPQPPEVPDKAAPRETKPVPGPGGKGGSAPAADEKKGPETSTPTAETKAEPESPAASPEAEPAAGTVEESNSQTGKSEAEGDSGAEKEPVSKEEEKEAPPAEDLKEETKASSGVDESGSLGSEASGASATEAERPTDSPEEPKAEAPEPKEETESKTGPGSASRPSPEPSASEPPPAPKGEREGDAKGTGESKPGPEPVGAEPAGEEATKPSLGSATSGEAKPSGETLSGPETAASSAGEAPTPEPEPTPEEPQSEPDEPEAKKTSISPAAPQTPAPATPAQAASSAGVPREPKAEVETKSRPASQAEPETKAADATASPAGGEDSPRPEAPAPSALVRKLISGKRSGTTPKAPPEDRAKAEPAQEAPKPSAGPPAPAAPPVKEGDKEAPMGKAESASEAKVSPPAAPPVGGKELAADTKPKSEPVSGGKPAEEAAKPSSGTSEPKKADSSTKYVTIPLANPKSATVPVPDKLPDPETLKKAAALLKAERHGQEPADKPRVKPAAQPETAATATPPPKPAEPKETSGGDSKKEVPNKTGEPASAKGETVPIAPAVKAEPKEVPAGPLSKTEETPGKTSEEKKAAEPEPKPSAAKDKNPEPDKKDAKDEAKAAPPGPEPVSDTAPEAEEKEPSGKDAPDLAGKKPAPGLAAAGAVAAVAAASSKEDEKSTKEAKTEPAPETVAKESPEPEKAEAEDKPEKTLAEPAEGKQEDKPSGKEEKEPAEEKQQEEASEAKEEAPAEGKEAKQAPPKPEAKPKPAPAPAVAAKVVAPDPVLFPAKDTKFAWLLKPWGGSLALLVLTLVLIVPGTWILPMMDRDEPRFANATWEMMERSEWAIPYFNNEYRFDKPPLTYWWMRVHYWMLGKTELAARLHSIEAAWLTAIVIMFLGRFLYGARAGLLAGIGWLTCVQVLIHGRLSVADMPMLLGVTAAMYAAARLLLVDVEPRRWGKWFWFFSLALSFGFLAKGPIALAVPLLSLLLARFVFYRKRLPWRRLQLFSTLGVILVVVGAWGIPALLKTKGLFWDVGIGKHVVERGTGAFNGRASLPVVYYLITVFISLFPWSAFMPAALSKAGEKRRDARNGLLMGWFVAPFLIFGPYSTQLPHYIMPGFPAFFLLLFRFGAWPQVFGLFRRRWFRTVAICFALFVIVLGGVLFYFRKNEFEDFPVPLYAMGYAAVALLGAAAALPWFIRYRKPAFMGVAFLIMGTATAFLCYNIREAHPVMAMRQVWADPPPEGAAPVTEFRAREFTEPSLVFYSQPGWDMKGKIETAIPWVKRKPGRVLVIMLREWQLDDVISGFSRKGIKGVWPSNDYHHQIYDTLETESTEGLEIGTYAGFNAAKTSWVEVMVFRSL